MQRWRQSRVALRLGWRLIRPRGRSERIAAAAVVVAAALAMVALATTLGVLGALGDRHAVLQARAPIISADRDDPLTQEQDIDIGGQQVTLLVLGPRDGMASLPPGAPRWPRPGEVLLSPAARAAAGENPYLAALARGHDIGSVGRAGLRDPDELVVYRGGDSATVRAMGGFHARGFGASELESEDITPSQLHRVGALMLVIVGVATAVLITTVAAQSSAARRRRLAALELLGAPTRVLALLAAMQAAVLALLGCVLGVAIARPATWELCRSGLLGVRWWSAASMPSPAVPIAAVAVVAGVAGRAARTVDADAWRVRRAGAEGPVSPLRIAPALVGALVLLGVITGQRRHAGSGQATPDSAVDLLGGAAVALLVGLIWAGPVLLRAAARIAYGAGLAWRLGAARADHHARSASRLTAGVVALALTMGVATGVHAGIARMTESMASSRIEIAGPEATSQRVPSVALSIALRASAEVGGHAARELPSGRDLPWTSARQAGPRDAGYVLVVPAAQAATVAGAIERVWPAAPPLLDDTDLAAQRDSLTLVAGVLLAIALAVALLLLAIAVTLLAAQDRRAPDHSLLATGMRRRDLAAARAAEVVVTILPAALTAAVLAAALAQAVMHLDDSGLRSPLLALLAIPAATVALTLVLAATVSSAAPREDAVRPRHE